MLKSRIGYATVSTVDYDRGKFHHDEIAMNIGHNLFTV